MNSTTAALLGLFALLGVVAIVAIALGCCHRRRHVVEGDPLTLLLALYGGGGSGTTFVERIANLVRDHYDSQGIIIPADVVRRLAAMDDRMGTFVTRDELSQYLDDRLAPYATAEQLGVERGRINSIIREFNRHTHRFSMGGINFAWSVLWAILTGLLFAATWIIFNRVISGGSITSHVGHNIALTTAWHNWGFTWLVAFFVFWIGFLVGGLLSFFWQLGRRRSFGPDGTVTQVTSGAPVRGIH